MRKSIASLHTERDIPGVVKATAVLLAALALLPPLWIAEHPLCAKIVAADSSDFGHGFSAEIPAAAVQPAV